MHLLFITDNFPPETNAAAIRTYAHAREWVKMGHTVTIVTGAPNFPTGKVFEGYQNKFFQRENLEGIRVVRVWTYITANVGTVKRMIDFASFMVTATFAGFFVKKPDIIIATTPQFLTSITGWVLARLKRRPFVLELRDLWPESIAAVGVFQGKRLYKTLEWVARFIYHQADVIISVTHSFKRILIDMGIRGDKIHIITNGVHPDIMVSPQKREEIRSQYGIPRNAFLVGYVGTFGLAHSLATILNVARLTMADPSIQYVLMGDGAEKVQLIKKSQSEGLSNVRFIVRKYHKRAIEVLSALDVALVLLRDTPLFESVIPSKLLEAMAQGKSVILGARGESLSIVNEHLCGIGIRPENIVDLSAAIRKLQADRSACEIMGANGKRAIKEKYDRVALARTMIGIIQELRP